MESSEADRQCTVQSIRHPWIRLSGLALLNESDAASVMRRAGRLSDSRRGLCPTGQRRRKSLGNIFWGLRLLGLKQLGDLLRRLFLHTNKRSRQRQERHGGRCHGGDYPHITGNKHGCQAKVDQQQDQLQKQFDFSARRPSLRVRQE